MTYYPKSHEDADSIEFMIEDTERMLKCIKEGTAEVCPWMTEAQTVKELEVEIRKMKADLVKYKGNTSPAPIENLEREHDGEMAELLYHD